MQAAVAGCLRVAGHAGFLEQDPQFRGGPLDVAEVNAWRRVQVDP